MARCDMMDAMLGGAFKERQEKLVSNIWPFLKPLQVIILLTYITLHNAFPFSYFVLDGNRPVLLKLGDLSIYSCGCDLIRVFATK